MDKLKTSNELCDIGQVFWEDLREMYDVRKWTIYIDHLMSCTECKKGLKIDEVIDKDELIPIYS